MSLPQSFPLKVADGKTIEIPSVGFGTWAASDTSWAKTSTLAALKAGYRHIDGAWFYGVDKEIGEAIRESGIPREEIFITSKAWPHFLTPESVELCLDKVLENTGLEYVDLFLAHWPVAWKPTSLDDLTTASSLPTKTMAERSIAMNADNHPIYDWTHSSKPFAEKYGHQGSFVPTWKALQQLVRKGKARAVGVSNFSIADLEDLLPHSAEVPISCNQVELHPRLPQEKLIEFHKKHGIVTAAWAPLAGQSKHGPSLIEDPTVVRLAEKNGMGVGQLLQSWAVQRGTIPLGKSSTPSRIESNLKVRKLPDEDFEALNQLALPNGQGRSSNFGETFGVPLFDDSN